MSDGAERRDESQQRIDIDELFSLANTAAEAAGEILMKHLGRATIEFKGAVDLVTNADKEAEARIIDMIRERYPTHAIVAEESGGRASGHDVRWLVDPVDGTTNYAHGFPVFAVSIGVEVRGRMEVGVIFNPATGDKFTAVRGRGAQHNGKPIHVSKVSILDRALVATGFPYTVRDTKRNNLDHFEKFIYKAQGLRRIGAASLDMAYVATGGFDGYWEPEVNPWDIAAGWLLVEEAGGRVTDMRGRPYAFGMGGILASNGLIHDEMTAVLAMGVSGMGAPRSS